MSFDRFTAELGKGRVGLKRRLSYGQGAADSRVNRFPSAEKTETIR